MLGIHTCNEMNTTVKVINIYSHIVTVRVCVMRSPEIYSLGKFPVFNIILLTVVIMLYISPLHCSSYINATLTKISAYTPSPYF